MIVLTAPTGDIGGQVLRGLLDRDAAVRLIARDPSRLSAQAKGRVEVVPGSHGDPEVVTRAFAGADTVFWLAPPDYRTDSIEASYVDFTRPACEALTSQGVRRVVVVGHVQQQSRVVGRAGASAASASGAGRGRVRSGEISGAIGASRPSAVAASRARATLIAHPAAAQRRCGGRPELGRRGVARQAAAG